MNPAAELALPMAKEEEGGFKKSAKLETKDYLNPKQGIKNQPL